VDFAHRSPRSARRSPTGLLRNRGFVDDEPQRPIEFRLLPETAIASIPRPIGKIATQRRDEALHGGRRNEAPSGAR
jgi:hypothetical protein